MRADFLDIPQRFLDALFSELIWLALVVLPLWGLSLLAWHIGPWLLVAFVAAVAAVAAWTTWSLRRAHTSPWTILGLTAGLGLLQLAPVLLTTVL